MWWQIFFFFFFWTKTPKHEFFGWQSRIGVFGWEKWAEERGPTNMGVPLGTYQLVSFDSRGSIWHDVMVIKARSQSPSRYSAWLGVPRAGPALWNYPAPPYSRRINTICQKGGAWRVLPTFEILIISIHTSRLGTNETGPLPRFFGNGSEHVQFDFLAKVRR